MLEPVLGVAGVFPATQEFLQTARQVCNEHGALLVLDEVQTGMGRTGKMFAYQHYGLEPDIVSLAKGLGAGFPMGAMMAKEEVAATFVPGDHASTFGGNPLACAAAVATLKMIEQEKLVERAAERSKHLAKALGELRSHPLVREVRCIGLMAGVDLTQPVAAAVKEACRVAGVLIASVGDSTLRILPSLIISTEQIDQGVKVLREALAAAA
jgi:acetylornithine/succinyldiaminopimelate/putrescine aminotransferase